MAVVAEELVVLRHLQRLVRPPLVDEGQVVEPRVAEEALVSLPRQRLVDVVAVAVAPVRNTIRCRTSRSDRDASGPRAPLRS